MKIAISVSDKELAKGSNSPYFKALVAAGAGPEELELVTPSRAGQLVVGELDGVLFAGGEDVDPELYGERKKYGNVQINRKRDDFELDLLDQTMDRLLPILGICRGTQVINVKFGGTLYQDLKSDMDIEHKQEGNRSDTTHQVTVTEPDSQLRGSVEGSCRVNSLHHQAIRRLGHGLKATAYSSDDGLVEAVEAPGDYPFLLAVQWHPEEIADHAEQRKIFESFLSKCREVRERRAAQAHA
jgi:putative glutamine amidotransferase